MHLFAITGGVALILMVGLDAFQTIILPRRPTGRLRLTRVFYILTWAPWAAFARRIRNATIREQFFSIYGPLSLLLLLVLWALVLITGFGLVYFALGTPFSDAMMVRYGPARFALLTDLYVSGTTLFTLGLGDVVPLSPPARGFIIFESGVGLGLVALVVGYLPVLYTAFSRREISVAMLDARAGSPPTAAELLSRHGFDGGELALIGLLAEWERWSAELLESHVSYPILCYYRSQHDNQSWLAGLVTVLDACALLIATGLGSSASQINGRQAQLTFAIARHALVDLGHVFELDDEIKTLTASGVDRLPPADFRRLCEALDHTEIQLCGDVNSIERLRQLRLMYEPHAATLAHYLGLTMPLWMREPRQSDSWHKVAGLRSSGSNSEGIPKGERSVYALYEEQHEH